MATYGTEIAEPFDIRSIIEDAYEQAGMNARVAHDWATARRSMSLLNIEIADRGYNSWNIDPIILDIQAGVGTYTLPSNVMDVVDMTIQRDGQDRPITRKPLTAWVNIADKTMQGPIPSIAVTEKKPDAVKLHIWPVPNGATTATVWVQRMLYESKTSQYADLPLRMLPAYTTMLAAKLAAKSKDPGAYARLQDLRVEGERLWQVAQNADRDKAKALIRPAMKRV
jgi:hypothetical protein